MRETLIAVVGVAVLAGGCSLSSSGPTGVLRGSAPPPVISSAAPQDLGPVIEDRPDRPVAAATRGGVEPIAALNASARARTKWENLNPSELAASRSTGTTTGPAAPETTATLAAAPAARAKSSNYDRDAAMQGLINGGKAAAKPICSGC
jgi:hypothetical protein